MRLAVEILVQIKFFIIGDKQCHEAAIINPIVEDLDMAGLPALIAKIIIVKNLCLEAGGDLQYVVVANLTTRSAMVIAIIVDIMAILNVNVSNGRMIHKEVEAMEDPNSCILRNEVINMVAILVDRTEEVIFLLCNKSWIV